MADGISLQRQIGEIETELKFRRDVFGRRVAARKMKQSEADYRIASMEAALRTLQWLQRNETKIREAVGDA